MSMTPNTRKPTKKQVPDNAKCWYWYGFSWELTDGFFVRKRWCSHNQECWLPYSAIPDPDNTQQGEPK